MQPKILFIIKHRDDDNVSSSCTYSSGLSSGLYNSARFVVDMLNNELYIEAKLVQVVDNNLIDKEVTEYRPTHVIVEALWVVPDKFDILVKLHPNCKWIVRSHSELPFLANEGIAMEWLKKYVSYQNVFIASNSKKSVTDLKTIIKDIDVENFDNKVIYMPNYYPMFRKLGRIHPNNFDKLNVGCFGAIRPLKNNLIQAVAAINYADSIGKPLFFHVNGTRNEQGGSTNISNIRALFEDSKRHTLVEHKWMPHEEFLRVLETMDVSMNVSFTETFNIVAADSVSLGVPMVCSPEIEWSSEYSRAVPTDSISIVNTIKRVLNPLFKKYIIKKNYRKLEYFNRESIYVWKHWIKNISDVDYDTK